MIINITNRHDKVSPALREKIEAWLELSQERYVTITSAQITLDKTDRLEEAEATVHVAGRELYAKASDENLYAALDALEHKMDRQLAKIHDKQLQSKRAPKQPPLIDDDAVNDDNLTDDIQSNIENKEAYQA